MGDRVPIVLTFRVAPEIIGLAKEHPFRGLRMAETNGNHERRISTIEGEMKSVATKADLADLKHDLTQSFQSAIKDQTTELQTTLGDQSEQIRVLQNKESRLRGIGDTLRVVAPFIISIVAVVVAVARP